jgi:hypothetical protein
MVNSVKDAYDRFPITTILIFAITVIISIFVIDSNVEELTEHILIICGFTAFGTFFIEALFDIKKDIRKIIGTVIFGIIAIIIDLIIYFELLDSDILNRWVSTYTIVLVLGAVYILFKKSKVSLNKYALNLILNVKRSTKESIIWHLYSNICMCISDIFNK